MENGKQNGTAFSTVRLDLKTKLSVMASLIFSSEQMTETQAVKHAIAIHDLVDVHVDGLRKVERRSAAA